jgi:hypothetical protein
MAGPGREPLILHLTDDEAELLIRIVAEAVENRASGSREDEQRELGALLHLLEHERRTHWQGDA